VSCASDKYLQEYMRLKIIDRSKNPAQFDCHMTCNGKDLQNLKLEPTEAGYLMLVEGNMPYNTAEGQLQIDILSN
jgi:hypothetical protein